MGPTIDDFLLELRVQGYSPILLGNKQGGNLVPTLTTSRLHAKVHHLRLAEWQGPVQWKVGVGTRPVLVKGPMVL